MRVLELQKLECYHHVTCLKCIWMAFLIFIQAILWSILNRDPRVSGKMCIIRKQKPLPNDWRHSTILYPTTTWSNINSNLANHPISIIISHGISRNLIGECSESFTCTIICDEDNSCDNPQSHVMNIMNVIWTALERIHATMLVNWPTLSMKSTLF